MSRDSNSDIISENKSGFTVQASPLNQVKLELGAILIMGVVLLLIVDYLVANRVSQMMVLGFYGISAMGWIIIRVKKVLTEIKREQIQAQKDELSLAGNAGKNNPQKQGRS